ARTSDFFAAIGRFWVKASITLFPTTWMPDVTFSCRRFFSDVDVGAKSKSDNWSATIRLISSGIVLSNERMPASTCARGRSCFRARRAAATVVFVSPWTMTRSAPFVASALIIRTMTTDRKEATDRSSLLGSLEVDEEPLEVVVVDAYRPDATVVIVRGYEQRYEYVVLYVLDAALGTGRNFGIRDARRE